MLVTFAKLFAILAHRRINQRRRYTGERYESHPREVAEAVRVRGGTKQMIAAAWLHDTVEDTGVSLFWIGFLFGKEVKKLVGELTDVYTKEAFPELNRAKRKILEADRIKRISKDAKLIKLCDIRSNIKSICVNDPRFAKVYLKEKAHLLSHSLPPTIRYGEYTRVIITDPIYIETYEILYLMVNSMEKERETYEILDLILKNKKELLQL